MIARQSPSLQVLVPIKRVSRADMASQCVAAIAAIHANDIVSMYGSPHRYSRCENFLCLNGVSEVTQRVMDGGNQVRKLLWSHRVVPNVAADGGQLPNCMAAGSPVKPSWASKSESLYQALQGRLCEESSRPVSHCGLPFLADVAVPCRKPMESTAQWTRPAVSLNAGSTQTGKAVRLEGTLPGKVLLLRDLIAVEGLLHHDPAATHGSYHRGFAAGDPPHGIGGWQIVHWR
jgi:hypothetical protein